MPSQEQELVRLEKQSAEPGFWDDSLAAQQVMRRIAGAREEVATWRGTEEKARELTDLLELAQVESDAELAQAVASDVDILANSLEEMELSLAFSGEYDQRAAILAIHAGAGGTDSQDWAEMLMRMYLRWEIGRASCRERV